MKEEEIIWEKETLILLSPTNNCSDMMRLQHPTPNQNQGNCLFQTKKFEIVKVSCQQTKISKRFEMFRDGMDQLFFQKSISCMNNKT
jgi:rRNA pseudouridine-1189 N-methylase Emg1 (Nep1/Mra1 family)